MESNDIIKLLLFNWERQNKQLSIILLKIHDERLSKRIAPKKNSGVYVLGHLIAANERMMELLGLGEKKYSELEEVFILTPFLKGKEKYGAAKLKEIWNATSETTLKLMNDMPTQEWFKKHTAVSEEDFLKDAHRNKLNILITRIMHQQHHIGQLILLT